MGKQTTPDRATPKKGVTAPKGRPTRARDGFYAKKQVFGPTAQWIALTVFLVLVFVVLFILTGGGDFNPFNDDHLGAVVPSLASAFR